MANILQVSPQIQTGGPSLRPDTQQLQNQAMRGAGQVQMPLPERAAPDAVSGSEAQELHAQVNFESNYAAFVEKMQDSLELPAQLSSILFGEGVQFARSEDPELAPVFRELLNNIVFEDPVQLADYIGEQAKIQSPYSSELFDTVRTMMQSKNLPDVYRETFTQFVKTFQDHQSGTHLLQQMQTVSQDVKSLMLPSAQEGLDKLLEQVNWKAPNGDIRENTAVINDKIIPYMAKYIAKTHDYGPVRSAAVMFSLYAVQYENGDGDKLEQLFAKMLGAPDFKTSLMRDHQMTPREAFAKAIAAGSVEKSEAQEKAERTSNLLSEVLMKGVQGKAGTESAKQYTAVMNTMLANESVYLPLLHMVVPFNLQGHAVMSEMWVNPDEEDKPGVPGSEKGSKLFLKFSLAGVGNFELVTYMPKGYAEKTVELQLFYPQTITEDPKNIADAIGSICENNDLKVGGIYLAPKTRDHTLEEIFPSLQVKEKGINISI